MSDTKQMTKTEARAFVRRAREALRELDRMLDHGGTEAAWDEECNEAVGAVVHVQSAIDPQCGAGITGILATEEAQR
jgi:hypothetical protein